MSDSIDHTSAPAPHTPEPPRAAPSPPRPRRSWLTATLALLAVLVVGIFGGVLVGHATASPAQAAGSGFARGVAGGAGGIAGGGAGGGFAGGGFAGGGFTAGTIVSISGTTMVIKAADGTQKTITTTSTTKVTKTTSSTLSALKPGQKVTVIGPAGTNGDVAATSVSEGAGLRGFGGRPGGAGTRTPGTNG